ncbi:MAG: thioredoxin family protein [Bacteroidales bacterium]|nr:thioredoxin family protein [Bacteroidales bacterium]MCD8394922.1 thioredoxin family protein [Bacteroidales bacterium]
MDVHELMKGHVAGLVEFYDNSSACDQANKITEEVKQILGPDSPVFRINIEENPREVSLVKLETIPTIIIYRNGREEWRITSDFPAAKVLAERLHSSDQPPGAINPLKGRPRDW